MLRGVLLLLQGAGRLVRTRGILLAFPRGWDMWIPIQRFHYRLKVHNRRQEHYVLNDHSIVLLLHVLLQRQMITDPFHFLLMLLTSLNCIAPSHIVDFVLVMIIITLH